MKKFPLECSYVYQTQSHAPFSFTVGPRHATCISASQLVLPPSGVRKPFWPVSPPASQREGSGYFIDAAGTPEVSTKKYSL
jgi:hypothetical protein